MSQISFFDGDTKYKIDKPIRLIELFAGYGSQSIALDYLGVKYESWKICEWAVKSIQAYKDLHFGNDNTDYSKPFTKQEIAVKLKDYGISSDYSTPMTIEQINRLKEPQIRQIYNNIIATHNLVSVCNAKGKDFEIVDTNKYEYIMTYSFPCFTANSLVLTNKGYKEIIDIKKGDEVLSHDNKYHKVVNCFNNGIHTCYSIKGMGIDEIQTTSNHKFYVREKYRKGHKAIRCFKEPVWKVVKDLSKNDYLGIAINSKEKLITNIDLPTTQKEFWWLIGRYIGDGWLRHQYGIIVCCDKQETQEITEKLSLLPFKYSVVSEKTANKIHIAKKSLGEFCRQFGQGAINKRLTNTILDLPTDFCKAFLDGYFSADGCKTNGVIKANSVSRELIYGIAQCVAKVYKTPYRIYKVKMPKTKIIEDRVVNQNDWYQLVFKTERKKQDKAFYENGYIWYPIKEITDIGKQQVYDIEVEDSHSFTVQNTIVHNCQDLSNAGLQKGMSKGSGTRSGLLWEVERILSELENKPQILVMENVPQVIGSGAIKDFAKWLERLEQFGYKNYYKVINGKYFGIPQNRERCFMVSVLGNSYMTIKDKIGRKYNLRDFLDTKVSEEYYLTEKIIEYFVKHTKECKEKGNGFKFAPTTGDCVGKAITTRAGQRMDDNFVYVYELPHGYNDGGVFETDCFPTVRPSNTERYSNGIIESKTKIRKLTEHECWKLMGVKTEDYNKVAQNQSKSSMYHLAGDSIITTCLMSIFGELLGIDYETKINELVEQLVKEK